MYKTPEQWLKELNVQADPSEIAWFMDAQRWLDQKYPNKQKIEEITHDNGIIEKFLIGELTIKDFPKLKKISFISSGDLFKIKIINCPELDDFECMGSPVKEIDFGDSNKLDRIYIPDNLLETIKLPANPVGLVKLHAHNNKFSAQTLQILAPFAKKISAGSMSWTHYEYTANDKEKLKSILSKQVSQTTEIPSSSTSSQSQARTETPKKSLAQLQAEHAFYKNFFDNYLQNKRSELTDLKNKMDEEGNRQLDSYLQLQQPENRNKNREKRLKKSLFKKLTDEELQKILDISQEISDLEKKVNDLEMSAQMEVIIESFQTRSWFQGWFK